MKKLNWRTLSDSLTTYSENELLALIEDEKVGERRLSIMKRLHQRYCIVRAARERTALLATATSL